MYADISQPPAPLPQVDLKEVQPGISLLAPLSRRGHGPGIILLLPASLKESSLKIEEGVPHPTLKWAEEGYAVVEIQAGSLSSPRGALDKAIEALAGSEQCSPKDKVGLVAYDAQVWNAVSAELSGFPNIVAAVVYGDTDEKAAITTSTIPVQRHLAGGPPGAPERSERLTSYHYPSKSHPFATPFQPSFNYSAESISHTRNLSFLKPIMGGPYFDLEAIWEEHTYYEFADRSVEHTMSTMVQEPYVNHVPTMTGGIGRSKLSSFYRDHFIFQNADDSELELISRTIGIDRVIDEFITKFTHDKYIDWILPGVPPTGIYAEVPFTAVVNIRGDRLYHEHIAWDQGTLLRQLGLLPEYLPYPYPLPDGRKAASGKTVEYRVPVAGTQTAEKMREKNSVPSNEMFKFEIREVGDPKP